MFSSHCRFVPWKLSGVSKPISRCPQLISSPQPNKNSTAKPRKNTLRSVRNRRRSHPGRATRNSRRSSTAPTPKNSEVKYS